MYTADNTMSTILEVFPDFKDEWNKHLEYWEDDERGFGIDLSAFCTYISYKIRNNEKYDYQKLFNFIEELIVKGDEEVATAATTQFLENLVNHSSHGYFPLTSFSKYLGKESKAYCKAWDEFCGFDNGDIWD